MIAFRNKGQEPYNINEIKEGEPAVVFMQFAADYGWNNTLLFKLIPVSINGQVEGKDIRPPVIEKAPEKKEEK